MLSEWESLLFIRIYVNIHVNTKTDVSAWAFYYSYLLDILALVQIKLEYYI